ncbi:MAG: CapA family protein [Bacteroidales bacterium]|nr:CapA family protein [Bacteroidales bacterium]
MKILHIKNLLTIVLVLIISSSTGFMNSGNHIKSAIDKATVIENFDSGVINLKSYPGEDEDPMDWELNSEITYENSPWSLKLFGNTWKVQDIQTIVVETGDVWQVSAYIASKAEIQGFGIMDSANVLFYSFAGSEELNFDDWIPVYQGCFPEDKWNNYQLPLADDWLAFYGYLPNITSIVYVNDKDAYSQGVVYFDNIINITNDLPCVPEVSIDYSIGRIYTDGGGNKFVDVQFFGEVVDPDSNEHDFFWDFGDDSTSTEQDPLHSFLIADDHPYKVLLEVVDSTNMWGQASCNIDVDPGNSSFPITINFVGDIMLARKYEYNGGIIPTQGVEAIFEQIKPYLGDTADITVANLECPLTTHAGHHPTKPIYFKSSPANIKGLTYAGIDIVTLANNHILDYLLPGLQQTQSVLEDNDIIQMGVGANSYEAYLPVFYSKSGVNFAFLASSDRTGQYNNYQPYLNAGYNKSGFAYLTEYYIKKQINEVRNISDLVVMEWHSGGEYSITPTSVDANILPFNEDYLEDEGYSPLFDSPSSADKKIRHFAIDNGADLVICHHPHIIHGLELYHGKLIAHSLGNFVFDLDYPETYPTMILNSKVNETGFYEFTITPVYIDDYIPQRAEGGLGLHLLDYIAQCSKDLNTYLKIDRENVIAQVIMDTLNMATYETEYIVELPLEEASGYWETAPYPLDKEGSISSVNNIQPQGNYEFRLGREKIWFGNMEDEGCTLWNLNSSDENYCDTLAFEGERSIQHKRDAGTSSNIVTNFEERIICCSDDLIYSLYGYIKTLNASDVTIEIKYYADRISNYSLGMENIGEWINGDTPWTFYHKELTIPNGTKFFDIRLNSGVPNSGTAFSWFDNVSIICWDNWGEYDISQPIPVPNDYYFIQVKSQQSLDDVIVNYSETAFDNSSTITQNYLLLNGYQFISSRIIPENPDMQVVCSDLLDNLDFIRNTAGSMLRKIGPVWVNSIGDWNTSEGYLFRMNDPDQFVISGEAINPQTPIALISGYQLISYFPEQAINTADVFENVLDNLDFVRNTAGSTFRKIGPNWVNGIGNMQAGEGYLVKMLADDVLIYPEELKSSLVENFTRTEHFIVKNSNPYDPVWTIYSEKGNLNTGDEIAVYDGEMLVGSGVVVSDNIFDNAIPVFSNLYETGNKPIIKVWDKSENKEYILSNYTFSNPYKDAWTEDIFPSEDGEYSLMNFSTSGLSDEITISEISIYPNPTKGLITIGNLAGFKNLSGLKITDIAGKVVFQTTIGNNQTTIEIDLFGFEKGVYFISFSGKDFSPVKKIVIQ